jgi:hypothetical protein
MQQGRKHAMGSLAVALIAIGCSIAAPALAARAIASKPAIAAKADGAPSAKAKNTLRQWTGYVTALDKTSITVEKRGKKPATKMFTRHAEMSTVGEIEKSAHVTVYYRDEGGHAIAHRVVVKSETAANAGDR